MEDNAEIAQDIELTPQNWRQQFGEDGLVETPIGTVKMGANQLPKLFEKGRSEQFGMIKPTLENPQIIIEIPSNAIDGGQERGSSLLFVKTFLGKNGQKIYYFKSVTVKKDGLEVSVSNHLDKPKRIREELEKGKLKYRFDGGAQTEHYPANVSVSVSPENVQGKQEENAIWRTPKDTTTFSTEKQGLDYAQPNEVETAANGSELTPQIASSESKDSNNSAEKQEKTEKVEAQRQPLADEQGNPLNADGTLMLDEVLSIDELEDKDFSEPYRNVQLPTLPANVNEAIGADNKPVIIKKSIFEKNRSAHKFTSAESRAILTSALYNTDLTGRTQPSKKPLNWVVIKIDEKSPIAVLEVNNEKNNTEIVGWYTLDERNLERIKRQAYKNGGELIMLSPKDKVESLSTPLVGLSSDNKDSNNSAEKQEKTEKIEQKPAQPSARTANVAPSKPAAPSNKIEDYGEVIKGARKDAMKELAKSVDNATLESLISLPFAKAFKRPDLRKAVDEGALREQDARFAEAVMASYLSTKKPKADTKKDKYRKAVWGKSKVEVWADEAYKGVQLLKQLFEAEPAERDRIMAEALAEHYTGVEAAKAHQERLKEWNPGKTFTGESYPINNVALFNEVLGRLGNDVGTADIPVVGAMPNTSYDSYLLVRPNGDTLFPTHTLRTFEDVVDEVVYLTKLNNADADTEHPGSAFKARGLEPQKEVVGYYVSYFPTIKSTTIRREEFKTKEAADAFYAKISKNGAMASEPHEMYRISGYGKYEIVFKNPITEEWVDTGMTYESEGDALFAIDQERDALNKAVNDKLAEASAKTGKTKATEYIQVRSYFDSGKMKYGVVIADKYGPKKTAFSTMPYYFAEGFATRKEAETALEKNRAEWEGFVKDIIRKRQEYVYFDGKNAPRVGKDYRGGKDVTEKDFAETFGFRGVQFGNWTNQNDRQAAVNNAYDSFMDLANIIGVSPRALSLNGELGIAFGSRGSGRANAHYESNNVVINLTKTRGAGSLAHEWWHALDNYFARQAKVPAGFVTSDKRLAMREQLRQAFDDLIDDVAKPDYNTRSSERGTYWGSPIEETARLFEEWVVDEQTKRGERNHFLAEGIGNAEADYAEMNYLYYKTATEMSNESRKRQGQEPEKVMSFEEFKKTPMALAGFVYPSAEELRTLGEDVRAIFDTVQERVDEETGNVALFHRGDNSTTPPASIEADRWNAIVDMVKESVGADNVITNPEEVKAEYDRIMAGQQRVRERIVEDANSRFNEQLEQQIAGTLPQGHIYQLGTPSPILLSCGLPNLPIELAASRLSDKSMQENHPFDLPEIEGLVDAIQNPLAVFRSATRIGSNVILTELKHGDKSFVVAIQTNRRKGRITVNDIRSIHYRNTDMNIVNWINEGLADYIKPTFAQEWLEPTIKKLRSKPQYNSAEVRAQLKDVAKVVKKFENPKVEAENLRQCIVYHGSGADFEKFDHSHMGEGEGAQAYGWGTYVTEVNGIAKSYAEATAKTGYTYKGYPAELLYRNQELSIRQRQVVDTIFYKMSRNGMTAEQAIARSIDDAKKEYTAYNGLPYVQSHIKEGIDILNQLKAEDFKRIELQHKNLYTVDIPDDNGQNYLKWNARIKGEQAKRILDWIENSPYKKAFDHEKHIYEQGGERFHPIEGRTGKDVYEFLKQIMFAPYAPEATGSADKRASQALSEMGFVGISYPAQYRSGGRFDGARNYVIFNENDAQIVDHERYFRTPNGEVYGFTIGGRIYLDSSKMNAETPIHEYTELWSKVVAENNPELWRRGKELLTETDTWKEVNADKDYKDLSEDERASETLSRIVAKDAAKKISEISDNKTLVAKLRAWLRQFWKDLKATFSKWSKDDLSKLKVDEFTKIPLRDLVEKVDLSKYTKAKNGQARMAQDRAELNAVNAEREAIVSRAKADGTYMKAPNGKPTNLTERQWADVRTSRFKEWFGDWEKAARVAKLRDSKAVEITGEEYKGKYELNRESAQRYIQANLRGEYQIDDTGEVIRLSNKGAKKVMSHGMSSEAHLKSVAVIPEIIRNGIFIDETTAEKPNSNYDSYRYYVCGLNIGGVDYTVRMTIGVKNGEYYYDHSLTEIEKGNLIEIANGFTPKGDAPIPSYANGKDTRIIPLLQTNSSKVVDENGEPLVVYHGTPSGGFNVFDNSKKQSLSYPVDGYVFASNRKVADGYSISGIYAKGEQMNGTPINPENENIEIVKDAAGRYMKAPNGKPTNLTERQWADVRTSRFKEWFGDWEKAAIANKLLYGESVAKLSGNEFAKDGTPLTTKVAQFYKDKFGGAVTREGLGEVILDERSVKDSMSHGIGRTKSAAFAAVPDIIKDGVVVDTQTNWKDRGYDSATIAAPVSIGGKDYIGMVVVKRSKEFNRFYLHEVFLKESLLNGDFQTGLNTGKPSGDIANVIKDIVSANKTASKVVDENGEPMVVYHGTAISFGKRKFDTFDTENAPSWFTPSKHYAEVYSKARKGKWLDRSTVYPAFLNIRNLKDVGFVNYGGSMALRDFAGQTSIPIEDLRAINRENQVRIYGNGNATYDDSVYMWYELTNSPQFRDYLIGKGYDGIKTEENEEAYAVFSPNQIKSATDNVGTYDSRENDIRFMFAGEKGAVEADRVEEATTRMDNLAVARKMEVDFKERPARLERLRNVKPVVITGREIEPSDDRRTYINNAFEYGKSLRGQYVNKDTGKTVELSRSGLKEVLHHDTKDNEQIQSIAAIPQMIENSVYITTIPNTDSRSSADSFDYYVTGLKIGGVDYTAKIVVANIDGKRYYDHKLTDIEKGNLIDLINKAPDSASNSTSSESSAKSGEISSDPIRIPNLNQEQKTIFAESGDVTNPIENPQSDAGKQTTLSDIKDKRLLDILQTSDEENAKRIKLATGWERGADGKWRYEIPDAKIKDTIEIEGKSFKRNEEDMLWTSGKLGNMVDAPDLFETYPQLKDVRLETDEVLNGAGSNGYYDPKRNMIVIHADKLDYLNGILNHEIQHAIQDIEGFAQGGNPDMLQSQNAERVNELQQMRREIEQEVAEGNTDREDELEEIDLELGDYDPEIGGYDYYRHLSGEVEARNVERRMKMTPEERRASLASATEDVARDDQVFLYDNLDVASSKAQTSGNDNDILYRSDDAVKNRIEALFNKAISGEFKGKPISIGRLTDEGKAYLEQVSGETFKDNVDFVLNPSDLIHIYKEHFGNNEKDKGQNIPLGIEDVRNLVDVISSPDKVVFFKEGEGLNRNMFYFFKEAEDGTYNLMEIYSDRKGNLTAKTFYKTKKGSSQRVIDIEKSLLLTSETSLVHPLSDAKIPQMLEFSKSDVADVEDNESQERTQVDALSAKIAALQAKARNRTQNVRELTAEVIRFVKDKANDEVLKNLGEQRFRSMMNGVQAAMMKIASDRITPERQRAEIRRQLDKIDTRITEASVKSNRDAIEKMLNLRVYKFNPMGVLMGNRISENTRRIFDLVQAGITTSSKSWNDRENRYVYYYTLKEGQATTIEDLLQQIDRQMYELPVEDNSVMHKIYAVQILQRYNNAITIHDAIDEINSNLNTAMADRSAAFRAKQAALEAGDADKHAEKLLEWRRLGEEIVGLQGDLLNRTHLYNDALAEFRQGLESLIENGRSAWLDAVQQEAEERLALMRTAFSSIRVPGAIPYKEKEIGKDVAETKENRNNELRTLVSNALPAVATFDSMLRAICINDIGNRYGLYDKIMGGEDGLVFASDKQYKNKQMMFSMVEDKIKELGLGKDINALIARSKKPTDMKIFNKGVPAREKHNGKIMRDGDGNIIFQMIELNVGELMYLYSSSRQEQGRKMLLNAGIDELQIDTIADYIADEFPKEKQFVDWVTDELLPTQRCERYNGLYEYLYKTQMPDTPHYFPLEVNKKQLYKAEEIGEEVTTLPTSTVGSIIARREHNYGLNLDTNFVDKLIGHINDMEHWYAFAKPIKQINTLLSSTQFRNVVEAQAKGAVSLLKQVANIAVGGNEPNQAGKLPKLLRAISRNDMQPT